MPTCAVQPYEHIQGLNLLNGVPERGVEVQHADVSIKALAQGLDYLNFVDDCARAPPVGRSAPADPSNALPAAACSLHHSKHGHVGRQSCAASGLISKVKCKKGADQMRICPICNVAQYCTAPCMAEYPQLLPVVCRHETVVMHQGKAVSHSCLHNLEAGFVNMIEAVISAHEHPFMRGVRQQQASHPMSQRELGPAAQSVCAQRGFDSKVPEACKGVLPALEVLLALGGRVQAGAAVQAQGQILEAGSHLQGALTCARHKHGRPVSRGLSCHEMSVRLMQHGGPLQLGEHGRRGRYISRFLEAGLAGV